MSGREEKEIRLLGSHEKIFDLYHWDEVLQEEGDGGKVVVCKPKGLTSPSGASGLVMKIRSKESLQQGGFDLEEQFRRLQRRMLNLPPHPGVLPIHDVLEDERFYYVTMAKASGGSFFPALVKEYGDGVMPAEAVRSVMRDILEAVRHVHRQGMLHRDLKPDNLVMQGKRVALIDFDHADMEWDPSKARVQQHTFCGTVRFSAPETFLGFYTEESDLYSVGVILYLMLTGRMPYDDNLYDAELKRRDRYGDRCRYNWRRAINDRLKEASIDWTCSPWTSQPLCRDFCRQLLAFEPGVRLGSADVALGHAWFQDG